MKDLPTLGAISVAMKSQDIGNCLFFWYLFVLFSLFSQSFILEAGRLRREIRLEFRRGCLTADNAGGRMMYRRQEVGRS